MSLAFVAQSKLSFCGTQHGRLFKQQLLPSWSKSQGLSVEFGHVMGARGQPHWADEVGARWHYRRAAGRLAGSERGGESRRVLGCVVAPGPVLPDVAYTYPESSAAGAAAVRQRTSDCQQLQ